MADTENSLTSNQTNSSSHPSQSDSQNSEDVKHQEDYSQGLQELKPGQILGKYELVEEAGKGGMGFIWKAKDTISGIFVALKFVPLNIQHHEYLLEEMRKIFILMQRLRHPSICPMLSLERDETYGYFQVMDGL